MDSKILIASVAWAFTGALVGFAIATPVQAFIESRLWILVAAITSGVGVLIGLAPSLRGKVGVPAASAGLALVGWQLGDLTQSWQLGVFLILMGALVGSFVGLKLQAKFTRNTRRTSGSDFYRS